MTVEVVIVAGQNYEQSWFRNFNCDLADVNPVAMNVYKTTITKNSYNRPDLEAMILVRGSLFEYFPRSPF
jgi:hypothetical protein